MRLIHLAAAAALLTIPSIALAQTAGAERSGAATSGSTSSAAPRAEATAVTAGLPVKDKEGKPIGKVTEVKTDANGKSIATIKMGADSFGVNTSALAVENGTATINATKHELDAHLAKGR